MDLVRIGQTLREIRLCQKTTLDQLARKTGLSKGFLSRVENFRITPSLGVLNNITKALGIGMADLFQENIKSPEYVFGRIEPGEMLIRDHSNQFGTKYFALAYRKLDRILDPFLVEYRPCVKFRPFNLHEADEFYLLLDGEVDFFLFDKTNRKRLKKGDTVYLSRNIPHTVTLPDGVRSARALIVYSGHAVVPK